MRQIFIIKSTILVNFFWTFVFQDTASSIKKKLKKAFCEPGNITDNGILSFCKYVIIPVVLRGQDFVVERAPENGGNVNFSNYEVCLFFILSKLFKIWLVIVDRYCWAS